MSKIYVNDVGTSILLDTLVDISSATLLRIEVKKPNGALVNWSASLDGTTRLLHNLQANDVDQPGIYLLQPYVETPSWSGRGETVTLSVHPRFK